MKPKATCPETPSRGNNRLASESSPYLLQHAHNPVDWYPWSPEAFERARAKKKPVFLSIGYSACHWCHVMAHESFEDAETAQLLNTHFVSIKVDREERPDIDTIYMQAVQMMTGSGGWPLSVFLTPDARPFYGGTYFPPESRFGMPSFRQVLGGVARAWESNPDEVAEQADTLSEAIQRDLAHNASASSHTPDASVLDAAFERLRERYDRKWGGFTPAPKFPSAATVSFLLRRHSRTGDATALEMAETTLDRMAMGGLYDQAGGGFHRYSTDERWLVPHFEKMLYDNALLAIAYTEAWQLTHNPLYKRIARDTLTYLVREMTDESGGFHSAEDADSEGSEGLYYLWTTEEIARVVGAEETPLAIARFGATDEGNFEGRNILHLAQRLPGFARDHGLEVADLIDKQDRWTAALREARAARVRPARDDKVLAAWNGMAISALARASRAFGDAIFRIAAEKAAEFVLTHMMRHGKLVRTWRRGKTGPAGYLDDYAHVALSLLDLYEATLDPRWLGSSERLAETMVDLFQDESASGFLYSGKDNEQLIAATKPGFDDATPSGNSVAAMALLRLGRLLDRDDLRESGEAVLRAFGKDMTQAPTAFLDMMAALEYQLFPGTELVIAGDPDAPETLAFLKEINSRFFPGRLLAHVPPVTVSAGASTPGKTWTENRLPPDTGARAWVCRHSTCLAPGDSPEALANALDIASDRALWSRSERQ